MAKTTHTPSGADKALHTEQLTGSKTVHNSHTKTKNAHTKTHNAKPKNENITDWKKLAADVKSHSQNNPTHKEMVEHIAKTHNVSHDKADNAVRWASRKGIINSTGSSIDGSHRYYDPYGKTGKEIYARESFYNWQKQQKQKHIHLETGGEDSKFLNMSYEDFKAHQAAKERKSELRRKNERAIGLVQEKQKAVKASLGTLGDKANSLGREWEKQNKGLLKQQYNHMHAEGEHQSEVGRGLTNKRRREEELKATKDPAARAKVQKNIDKWDKHINEHKAAQEEASKNYKKVSGDIEAKKSAYVKEKMGADYQHIEKANKELDNLSRKESRLKERDAESIQNKWDTHHAKAQEHAEKKKIAAEQAKQEAHAKMLKEHENALQGKTEEKKTKKETKKKKEEKEVQKVNRDNSIGVGVWTKDGYGKNYGGKKGHHGYNAKTGKYY